MPASGHDYRGRRARLAGKLRRPLVIFAGHPAARNYAANAFPFRPASTYTYFGGPPIENAALLIEPGGDGEHGCALLRVPTSLDDEVWLGPQPSDADLAARAQLPVAEIFDVERLAGILNGREAGAILPQRVQAVALAARLGLKPVGDEEMLAIIDLRLQKDEHELAQMRRAAEVSCEAHLAAMAVTRPGVGIAQVAAEFLAVLTANECDVSFTPIITTHGEILHALGLGGEALDGELMLCDAAAEEAGGYASDITRVWPVNGRWTGIQRALYDTVLRANQAAIEACIPGRGFRDIHDLSARVICEGLVDAELLRGSPPVLAERRAHTLFFTHGLGHLIGLDVHDMEDFGDLAGYAPGRTRRPAFGDKFLRLDRDLAPGMCLTIEPGLYLVPAIWRSKELVGPLEDCVNRANIDKLLAQGFGGIRIEHTICVSAAGPPEILTEGVPTDADEVAACVGIE